MGRPPKLVSPSRRKGLRSIAFLLVALCSGLGARSADAQNALDRFERQLEQIQRDTLLRVDTSIPPGQRMLFDYGGFITTSFLAIDDAGQNTHILRQNELTGYALLNLDDVHQLFIRGRSRYRDFNSGDSFDGRGDDWVEAELQRAHYRFDLQRYMGAYEGEIIDYNLVLQGGRQLVVWASGLTLNQEIDGIAAQATTGPWAFDLVAGSTLENSVDFDSSRPAFDGDTNRHFYGGMLSRQMGPSHRPFVYGLIQKDANGLNFDPDPLSDLRAADPTVPFLPTRFSYDSYYLAAGSTGSLGDKLLYSAEFVYQGGEGLSNSFAIMGGSPVSIPQTTEDIEAYALDLKFDYLFHDENHSRAVIEVVLATGDDDRGHTSSTFSGNLPGTDDTSFNAFGLVNTGLAFTPQVSNLIMTRAGLATYPLPDHDLFKRLQVGADVFVFNKFDRQAPIEEPTGSTSYLGFETDLFANWQISSDLSLAVRYGVFFPGGGIRTDHDSRHFVYTGLTYSF